MRPELQSEHKAWLDANYPKQPPWHPALGMIEEASELLRAYLKHMQMAAYGEDTRYRDRDWYAEMYDAVGDCALYAVSWCNANGVEFEPLVSQMQTTRDETVQRLIGALVRAAADTLIYGWPMYVAQYIGVLKAVSAKLSVPFEEAVDATWQKVRTRKREPKSPLEPVLEGR